MTRPPIVKVEAAIGAEGVIGVEGVIGAGELLPPPPHAVSASSKSPGTVE
jgi:hypothetical protein